jgi:hypothetical protein
MSGALVAAFDTAEALVQAALAARRERFTIADAFSPYPLEGLEPAVPVRGGALGWAAAIGGLIVACLMFAGETWTSVYGYPFNSGARPLFSWPVLLFAPFEMGVLAAAVCGFGAFLAATGLPQLHHADFDLPDIDHATQDRFLLAIAQPRGEDRLKALRTLIGDAGGRELREAG